MPPTSVSAALSVLPDNTQVAGATSKQFGNPQQHQVPLPCSFQASPSGASFVGIACPGARPAGSCVATDVPVAMQQRLTGSADGSGSMPDPFRQPTEYLLAFLHRIAVLDKEGFFQRPVREEEAPNYYTIIKQPMCFAHMREKIAAGSYQTWRQLRDDFNLIHENARRFNSNKTLVHRAALNLQKNGTKILATYELEVRKALAVLHPLGAQQRAGHGTAGPGPAAAMVGHAVDSRMDFATSPTATASVSAVSLAAADQNGEQRDGLGMDGCPVGSGPPSPDAGVDGFKIEAGAIPLSGPGPASTFVPQPPPQFPFMQLPAIPRDPLVGYISDEEDQPLLVVGTDAAAVAVAAAASRSLPGLGPSHALPLDALLSQLRTTAVRVPYSGLLKGDEQAGPSGGVSAEGPAGRVAGSNRSREWKRARRPVELQARWLELRMRELRSQQERLRTQICWLQQRKEGGDGGDAMAALAGGITCPAAGVLAAAAARAAAPCSSERTALETTARGFMLAGRISNSPYFRFRPASRPPAEAPAPGFPLASGLAATAAAADAPAQAGLQQPSTSAAPDAGVSGEKPCTSQRPQDPRRVMPPPPQQLGAQHPLGQRQQQQGPGRPAALPPLSMPTLLSPHQLPPCDEAEADKVLPGAVFASLELLEQRLSLVRSRLQDTYKFDPNRMTVGRTPGQYGARPQGYPVMGAGQLAAQGMAAGPPMLPSTSSQGGAVKRQSSSHGRRPGSLTVLTRFDSMGMPGGKSSSAAGGGKRKRSEVELLAGDIGTPLAYSRTSIDRSMSVSAIVIPPVRELPPDEFRARIVAATTWSQHYHTIGPSALESVPPEILTVLRKRRRRGFGQLVDEFDEDMGVGMGGRGLMGVSDDEGAGLAGFSDSGVGDDEGSSSSSEDTSDEAYAGRHRLMEEEEHRRYAAVVAAEGQRRRNKGQGSNMPGQQQSQGGPATSAGAGGGGSASQAKERAKLGHKTPRYSNSFKGKEGLLFIPPDFPMDAAESAPPSATQSHYQPYQPPMVGVTAATALPPTPGATPAAVMVQLQPPVVVQQAVAQRTSSPPAVMHISPAGAQGPQLQRQAMPLTTMTVAPSPSAAAAAARQAQPARPAQQTQLLPPQPHAFGQQFAQQAAQPYAVVGADDAPGMQQLQPPLQSPQTQLLASVQPQAQGQSQQPPEGQLSQPLQLQQHAQSQQQQHAQVMLENLQQQQQHAHALAQQQRQELDVVQQVEAIAARQAAAAAPAAAAPPSSEVMVGSAPASPTSANAPITATAQPSHAAAASAPPASTAPHASNPQDAPVSPVQPQTAADVAAEPPSGLQRAASASLAAVLPSPSAMPQSMVSVMSGMVPAIAPSTAAAMGLSPAAAMAAEAAMSGSATMTAPATVMGQSPAVSMQFLAGIPGLTGSAGAGGPANALTAAATSILLAAAAAAGQGAAANLMGGARSHALQQLAAGTPAAQVLANAAAAATAATGGPGNGPVALGAAGAPGKPPPPLFTGTSARGVPGGQSPLAAAGVMSGLPAAFQTLPGFPHSLAGHSLAGVAGFNTSFGGGVGMGAQHMQRLPDGHGIGVGLAYGMPAPVPAPRQGQVGPAEGRGVGRGRRASRVTVVEDDEDWEEEEEEEAVSPSTRTRRSGRPQRRGSNGNRSMADGHGNGGTEATRQSRRRAAKGAQNWAVLLASDSSDDEDEEWGSRAGARRGRGPEEGRGRGRRAAG